MSCAREVEALPARLRHLAERCHWVEARVIEVDREVLGGGCGLGSGAAAAGAAADVEVEFIDVDGTLRREPLSGRWNVAFERVAPVRGLRRSAGSATGRVCGGSPLPVSMWDMSPGSS